MVCYGQSYNWICRLAILKFLNCVFQKLCWSKWDTEKASLDAGMVAIMIKSQNPNDLWLPELKLICNTRISQGSCCYKRRHREGIFQCWNGTVESPKLCDETIRQATSFNLTCYMPTLQAKFDTSKSHSDPKEDTEKTYPMMEWQAQKPKFVK